MYAKAFMRLLLSLLVLSGGSLGSQLRDGDHEWESIVSRLIQAKRFWNFLGYSYLGGQAHDLPRLLGESAGGVTFLVPTDSAFQILGAPILAAMRSNHTFLKQLLAYHIVEARTSPSKLKTDDIGETYRTAQGSNLQKFRSVVPGKVQLGPEGANSSQQLATIIQSNLFQDSAALVHVVNRVLIPI